MSVSGLQLVPASPTSSGRSAAPIQRRLESGSPASPTWDFLAVLSHELRNAIAPMANAVHVLRLTAGPEGVHPTKAYDLLERQIALMSHLVNDLQDVAIADPGLMHFHRGQIDLRPVVTRSVAGVMSAFAHRRHEVAVALLDDPIWVDADPVRLEQVLVNLVSNAAKYTPDGGCISVTARRAHGRAEVRVVDNGIGIPTEMLNEVFGLFVRLEPARAQSRTGLGIGLHVVKRIVERHGGTVVARSAGIGTGSEFVVSLPLIPTAA